MKSIQRLAGKTGTSKGRIFPCPNPILIPDFDRAGKAMSQPQKSLSKLYLERLKKQN
jgi:hypothetical protein